MVERSIELPVNFAGIGKFKLGLYYNWRIGVAFYK